MTDRLRDLFASDITRDIPPVVYFHEQDPHKLAAEVSEYIITGGWPSEHPNHRRVPTGIHEQYVHLLTRIASELDKPGGPDLPNVWISGFYGSGKSSFAKLLGLALDGVALPNGDSLAAAWLDRDTSPLRDNLRNAWHNLRKKIDPIAVVFDVGGSARDGEHIHSVAVRRLQARLGYSTQSAHVAYEELQLERAGRYNELVEVSQELFGAPWPELHDAPLAQARFSKLMHRLHPEVYVDEADWDMRRAGASVRTLSPEEAIEAIRDMLRFRRPGATLFFVIDEVSQYVLSSNDRVERLRAFASALGSGLKGKAWLMALGQQKLEEDADASFLVRTKDRFPPHLRVHLASTNIRDVVHKRLLQKSSAAETRLRALFAEHRASLALYAYGCESVTPDDFVEVYPLLPGHIDLLMQITSAMRTRSSRAQGDDQAIRGLLQLLGELFREHRLADAPVGTLVSLDRIYDIQHTALDADVQSSMARVLHATAKDPNPLRLRAAKAVALLELIQDTLPTDAKLVAQCLYERVDLGNQVAAITDALESLRRQNLLGYSEKHGYKIQSSAGEEWERERREIHVARDAITERAQAALKYLLASPDRPRHQGRAFPWAGVFSDGRQAVDAVLLDPRDDAVVRVDLRYLSADERTESAWIKRSAETALYDRLVWVCGEKEAVDEACRELARSERMVGKYEPRRESLNAARKMLLQSEKNRVEELNDKVRAAVATSFMAGKLYFRGRSFEASERGAAFAPTLSTVAEQILPDLFPHMVATQVAPAELLQLLQPELAGPSPKFLGPELGILELDAGRYVPSCAGEVPQRVLDLIEREGGVSGTLLLATFGGPPYGYVPNVVKACVAGLLRGGRVRVQPEGGAEITAIRDAGVRDLFDKDRSFRRASFFPGEDEIGFSVRARICKFFKTHLDLDLDREDHLIADAVSQRFPLEAGRLREVLGRLVRLPGPPPVPEVLDQLQLALEQCVAKSRQTRPTVRLVKQHLNALQDGFQKLNVYSAELTDEAVEAVRRAAAVRDHHLAQLESEGALPEPLQPAATRLREHLASERPWQDISTLDADLQALEAAYAEERTRRLAWQEEEAEQVRSKLRAQVSFSTLTGDQSHHVLRPIQQAQTDTTEHATAPSLAALTDPFVLALDRAEEEALARLDEATRRVVSRVDLGLKNREVRTPQEVDALVGEIRERLMAQIEKGTVRLV